MYGVRVKHARVRGTRTSNSTCLCSFPTRHVLATTKHPLVSQEELLPTLHLARELNQFDRSKMSSDAQAPAAMEGVVKTEVKEEPVKEDPVKMEVTPTEEQSGGKDTAPTPSEAPKPSGDEPKKEVGCSVKQWVNARWWCGRVCAQQWQRARLQLLEPLPTHSARVEISER